jgi:hypothetical protein
MRAVLCDRFDGIAALRTGETAEPIPAADEILIDVHAASGQLHGLSDGLWRLSNAAGPPVCAGNGKRLDLKDCHKLLDVSGGSGAYTIAFCAAYPHLQATILDFPETVDTAKLYAGEAGLSDRISHLAGNAIKVEWPKGHDVVLMSYIWSAVGEADLAILAKRAAEALPPGGLVLIHDFMVDDGREGPPFAAWYLLGSMFDNPTALCLTPANVERVLRDAGFQIEGTETMLSGITMLTRASKRV